MIVHIVSISLAAYVELAENMAPEIRFVNVDVEGDKREFPMPHYWLYSPDGSVVVFTPVPIEKREHQ